MAQNTVMIAIALVMAAITAFVGQCVWRRLRSINQESSATPVSVVCSVAATFVFSCIMILVRALTLYAYTFRPVPLACHIGAASGYSSTLTQICLMFVCQLLPSFVFLTFMWRSGVSDMVQDEEYGGIHTVTASFCVELAHADMEHKRNPPSVTDLFATEPSGSLSALTSTVVQLEANPTVA